MMRIRPFVHLLNTLRKRRGGDLLQSLRSDDVRAAVIEPVGGHGGMDYYDFGLCEGLTKAGVSVAL